MLCSRSNPWAPVHTKKLSSRRNGKPPSTLTQGTTDDSARGGKQVAKKADKDSNNHLVPLSSSARMLRQSVSFSVRRCVHNHISPTSLLTRHHMLYRQLPFELSYSRSLRHRLSRLRPQDFSERPRRGTLVQVKRYLILVVRSRSRNSLAPDLAPDSFSYCVGSSRIRTGSGHNVLCSRMRHTATLESKKSP